MLWRCTLTGVDEGTDLSQVRALALKFPFAEFGVLCSFSRAGAGRYPARGWIRRLAGSLEARGEGGRFALHLCGSMAREFLVLDRENDARRLSRAFGRVQLNIADRPGLADRLRAAIARRPWQTVITQHNVQNRALAFSLRAEPRHLVLVDESGGRGISPGLWPTPIMPQKPCGYAGGLGPRNLAHQLSAIEAATGDAPYWVDMETGLRDARDRFSLHSVRACLEIARDHLFANRARGHSRYELLPFVE